MVDNKTQHLPTILIIALSVFFVFYMTAFGIGLTPDSVVYLNVSHNLASGNGFRVSTGEWISHYPPLYPAVWSLAEIIGVSELAFIRWIQIILLALFLITASLTFKALLPQKKTLRSSFLFLISTSFPLLIIFSRAWSEGLFLLLGFLSLYLLGEEEKKTKLNKWKFLVIGFVFALTALTRYAGIVFLGAAGLYLLFWSTWPWKTKIKKSLILTAPTALLLGLWILISYQKNGTTTNRKFGFYPISIDKIKLGIGTFLEWFFIGENTPVFIKLIVLVLFFILSLLAIKKLGLPAFLRKTKPNQQPLIFLLLIFSLVYPAFILFSILFLDANIPLDTRILSPLYFVIIFSTAVLVNKVIRKGKPYWGINFLLALIIIGQLIHNLPKVQNDHRNGIGFNHEYWRESVVWEKLTPLLTGQTLVSNAPEPIYYYTRAAVIALPRKYLSISQSANTLYADQINTLKTRTLKTGDLLVYFTKLNSTAFPSETELMNTLSWKLLVQTDQANIYYYNPE